MRERGPGRCSVSWLLAWPRPSRSYCQPVRGAARGGTGTLSLVAVTERSVDVPAGRIVVQVEEAASGGVIGADAVNCREGQALGGVRDRRRPARRNAVPSDGRAKIGGQWPVRGGYGHLRRRRWRARRQAAVSEREPGNGPAATGPISVRADQADAPAPVRRDSRLGLRTRRLCDDRLRQQRRRRAGRHRRGQLPCACDAWVLCNGRARGGHALHLTPSGPPRRHRERRRGHRAGSLVRMARWS